MSVANPAVLLFGVSLDQSSGGPLDREIQLLEQMPDMAGMIADVKFLLNDLGDQGRSPDSGAQPVSDGAAVQDIGQLFPLVGAQLGGPSAALAFQESFLAMAVPGPDPGMNPRAIHLEVVGDLACGMALDAEHDGLRAQGDSGCFVGLGLLAQGLEPWESAGIAAGEDGLHGRKYYVVLVTRGLFHHDSDEAGNEKGDLLFVKPILGIDLSPC